MTFRFHPEAFQEYQEAACYYADQQPGLDMRFTNSVERAIALILEDPYRWRTFEEDIRRCLTRVFPFGVLYTVEPGYVLIIAVAHCSREPGYWKHRLG